MLNDEELAILRRLEAGLTDNTAKTEKILLAFPGGDTEGHRRYHAAVIERIELRNKLIREALVKAAQAGGIVAFGWIGLALWQAFKITVKT